MIFVPATPRSKLKKQVQAKIREQDFKIKVIEKTGVTLKQLLQKSDPFKERRCSRNDCMICTTGGRGPCQTPGVNYEIKCKTCGKIYIGETSRTAYSRGLEHKRSIERKDKESVFIKHNIEEHQNDESTRFEMSVTGVYHDDAMLRQISESVRIKNTKENLNNKEEWRQNVIPKLTIANS